KQFSKFIVADDFLHSLYECASDIVGIVKTSRRDSLSLHVRDPFFNAMLSISELIVSYIKACDGFLDPDQSGIYFQFDGPVGQFFVESQTRVMFGGVYHPLHRGCALNQTLIVS